MGVNEDGRSDEDGSDLRTGERSGADPALVGEELETSAIINWLDIYANGGKTMGDPAYWLMAAANRLKEYEALTRDRG